MPLPFEKWGSDRRKRDDRERKDGGRKDKKKKSKLKPREEELLEREINLLKFQLLEERQNTRREKLNSARLLKDLADTKRSVAMKETLAQALYKKEQEQRARAEQRLSTALTDNEAYKTQLDHLRNTLTEQQQIGSPEAGPNNNGEVEPSDTEQKTVAELQKEKSLLLERLRIIESNNSALVVEGEKQQHLYERCLDEVAAQVVQALLIQRELKEECTKLRNRVEELEIHNRQLRHLYEQEVWMKKQTHESCMLEDGCSAGSSVHSTHCHNGSPAIFKHTFFSQTEMHHFSPHPCGAHLLNSPRVPTNPGAVYRQSSLPNSCFTNCLPTACTSSSVAVGSGISQGHSSSFHKSLPSSLGNDNRHEDFSGGGECLGSSDDTSDVLNDLTNYGPSDFSGNQCLTVCCDRKGNVRKTQSLPATPLAQRSSAYNQSHMRNQTTFEFTENQNYLSDKYTKPYVHAPLDYAQSLLQELRELGASVKSFESLTLEPKAINAPQKRKDFGEVESNPQPQKLVKGHDYLRGSCLSGALENSDTFSLEDFPPDGGCSIASGESIETAYERIIPSPEKSPQRNNNVVPKLQLEGNPSLIGLQGDVLFDLDEQVLDNDNFNGELLESFEDFAKALNDNKSIQHCNTIGGDDLKRDNSEKQINDQGIVITVDKSEVNIGACSNVADDSDICLLPVETSSTKTDESVDDAGADYCRSIIPSDEHDMFKNIEVNRTDPQWKIDAEKYQERPPTLPPRTHLTSSFESGSDEVFLASGGDSKKKAVPPELPPKPSWMRIGDINLSEEEPPPIPERKPILAEGEECLSWKYRKSYDMSDMEGPVTNAAKLPHEEVRDKAKETDIELSNLLSSESEEEEGLDYLAMWKAREKTPSWKACLDTSGAVNVQSISENQARLSAVTKNEDHQKNAGSNVASRRESQSKPLPEELQIPKVKERKESLIKKPSERKPEKKSKSSIPLFKSKKDPSKKGSGGREKSVVKDFVSSIKAVMDGSRSRSGEKCKGGNLLRKSSRSKSPKQESPRKKGNGQCSKGSSGVKGQNKADKDPVRCSRGVSVCSEVPKEVTNQGTPKGKPLVASSKQSFIPKVKHQGGKSPRHSVISQSSDPKSGQSAKTESKSKSDRRSKGFGFSKGDKTDSLERHEGAVNESTLSSNIESRNIQRAAADRNDSPVNKGLFLRVSSKGSINFQEPELLKLDQCIGVSFGSLSSFDRVPFIDTSTPDKDIMEISQKFSNLSSGSVDCPDNSPSKDQLDGSKSGQSTLCSKSEQSTLRGHSNLPNDPIAFDSEDVRSRLQGVITDPSPSSGQAVNSQFVDQKEVEDIKKGKLVRDFDLVNYNMNVLASRSACTLPPMGTNYSDPWLNRSKVKYMSQGHTPPERPGKVTQSDSVLEGGRYPDRLIQVPLVNGEIFDSCDESMDENASLEHGGEHEAQLSEKERATLLDSLFDTDSDEDADDGSCSQDASELASSDSHPEEKEFMKLLDERGDEAKKHAVRQGAHNRVSLMQVDICSMFTRYGDKERQALSSFDFLEKVLSGQDGEHPYLNDELNNGTKRPDSGFAGYAGDLQPQLHLSDLSRTFLGDTQSGDGQVSPFTPSHELTNTSMSSSLSTGSLSS